MSKDITFYHLLNDECTSNPQASQASPHHPKHPGLVPLHLVQHDISLEVLSRSSSEVTKRGEVTFESSEIGSRFSGE